MAVYKEISCAMPLNRINSGRLPFHWDLNVYRGCAHACAYCFARYTHRYLGCDDYDKTIFVKTNIVEKLEALLSGPNWNREVINIGGITDSYQPAESRFRFMPEILKLLIKYKTPAIISTKSSLILRDFDLIRELAEAVPVNIAFTITTADEGVRRTLEPGASQSAARFHALKEFDKTSAYTGLHLMPIIPFLTDGVGELDYIMGMAKECGADYVLPGALYLRGAGSRNTFFTFIQRYHPELYRVLWAMFQEGSAARESFKARLNQTLCALRKKYGLSFDYRKMVAVAEPLSAQLSMFGFSAGCSADKIEKRFEEDRS